MKVSKKDVADFTQGHSKLKPLLKRPLTEVFGTKPKFPPKPKR